MRLYPDIAKKSFQRRVAYRGATLAGFVTNLFFGLLWAAILVAVYGVRTEVAGYSYPMNIYQDWLRTLFTFVTPMAFVNYYPALWLLGKPDPLGLSAWVALLSPFVCLLVLAVGVRMWWIGVRHYQSTGS
jgi:ABC-type uncharacterized transport system permease subunit